MDVVRRVRAVVFRCKYRIGVVRTPLDERLFVVPKMHCVVIRHMDVSHVVMLTATQWTNLVLVPTDRFSFIVPRFNGFKARYLAHVCCVVSHFIFPSIKNFGYKTCSC
jgi:hypothetical protein